MTIEPEKVKNKVARQSDYKLPTGSSRVKRQTAAVMSKRENDYIMHASDKELEADIKQLTEIDDYGPDHPAYERVMKFAHRKL